jgi:hypothetical protein
VVSPIDDPVAPVGTVAAADYILSTHIRMLDGRCRGCFVERGHDVEHPCGSVEWAAKIDGRRMTADFLRWGSGHDEAAPAPEPGAGAA